MWRLSKIWDCGDCDRIFLDEFLDGGVCTNYCRGTNEVGANRYDNLAA